MSALSTLLLAAEAGEEGGLHFPPIGHLVEWPAFLFEGNKYFAFNKIALIAVLATAITLAMFFIAGRQKKLVPTGMQNVVESSVEFIRDGIALQTMGNNGLPWVPFLTALFFFILFNNIFEVIPVFQMPASARMAIPLFLAVGVWILYNVVGMAKLGPLTYFRVQTIPPGVPAPMLPLIVPLEFISNIVIRPFSLAVRLFANMLAGHILLVTFAVLTTALIQGAVWLKPLFILPFILLVFLTFFEIFVSFLQAYIFTILTALYLGLAMEEHH